jgi:DNA topoisomerase-1
MNLVIVESPTKAKTISRFLGKSFDIKSSYGHIRDLPKSEMGIDIENGYEPRYVTPKKAQKHLSELKKLAKNADKIILATDEDREGEAIAHHLAYVFKEKNSDAKIERIVFHEITKGAIEEAVKNPRKIDSNLVNAQQARRILDRLVGYKLSPFLWKKIMRGLSAGRVQSAALKLVVDREKEIRAFKSENYWTISAILKKKNGGDKEQFEANLVKINGEPVEKPGISDQKTAGKFTNELEKSKFRVKELEKKIKEIKPRPPFTTSTLQQAAWQQYKFSAKKTMLIAQQLYEGIELSSEGGATGLITYMRTDSLNISETAIKSAAEYVKKEFGEKYSIPQPRRFKTKSKGAQEAHEAIRPTDVNLAPDKIKSDLTLDQHKLYKLVWRRFVATQMANALFDDTVASVDAEPGENKYLLEARGSIMKFDGFLKVYPAAIEEKIIPELSQNEELEKMEIKNEKHETQPPPRFTDASLVKTLEKFGIGRPSTYAQILSTLENRNYTEKDDKKRFAPTEVGEKVNEIITQNFPEIVDIEFTAKMEDNLDDIAAGKKQIAPIIDDFYKPFEKNLEEKYKTVKKIDMSQKTDETCEKCGKPMIIKHGRFGKFVACSGFPECKNTKKLPPVTINIKCPLCKTGDVIEKHTKKKKLFYGCSSWPKCKFATWQKPTGTLCPECNAPLVELKNMIKCSNKECKYKEKERNEKSPG